MNRRDAIKKLGMGAAVAAAGTIVGAPAVHAKKTYHWKMVTTWGPRTPYLQTETVKWARMVDRLSGGRLKIKVYAANELVPGLGVFDAVSSGTYQAFHAPPYFWAGKVPAAQWFACVPFGLNAQGMNAWHYMGDGLKLWEEAYKPFGLVPPPGRQRRLPDGRLVQQEDRDHGRLEGPEDAHSWPGRQGGGQGRRHRDPDRPSGDLHQPWSAGSSMRPSSWGRCWT